VLVDLAAPAAGFFTPGLGRSTPTDWTIAGEHLAERCELFIIVALGESILITGTTFGELNVSAAGVAAFVVAFTGSVAFWWIYFDRGAAAGIEVIGGAADPGRLGRSAYTYFHLPMVAGIVVMAVGDELTIAHPTGHASTATILTVVGGPALFLAGHALFKWAVFGRLSVAHLTAIVALAALIPVGQVAPPLLIAALAVLIVAAVAWWALRTEQRVPHTATSTAVGSSSHV
jgi:low temperature requirement protein LtrA